MVKSFIVQAPGVNHIKLFWHIYTHSFCKVDHFKTLRQILFPLVKWSSLEKALVNLCQKSFITSNPVVNVFLNFITGTNKLDCLTYPSEAL